ncbi:MAG: hypothetical protein IKW00_05855 [Clostridia bacterium]|nr:hypothetical protein [Clostridia bacterium]
MKADVIVYSSQTGSTAQYARMLSAKAGIPAYELKDALNKVDKETPVLFMSWLMAGKLVDCKKAFGKLNVQGCCASCLNPMPQQADMTKNACDIPDEIPLFTMMGAYHPDKLAGMQKLIMKLITKILVKKILSADTQDEGQAMMRDVLTNGGSFVCEERLREAYAWLCEN